MDVNQVRFGNFSIGNQKPNSKKEQQQEENVEKEKTSNIELKQFDVEKMFEAMDLQAMQLKSQIANSKVKEVDPAKFLSEERMNDIEAMMAEFELGVDTIAQSIEDEFPNTFSQAQKNALAADIFARD